MIAFLLGVRVCEGVKDVKMALRAEFDNQVAGEQR